MAEMTNPMDDVVADAVDDAAGNTSSVETSTDIDTTAVDLSSDASSDVVADTGSSDQVPSPGADLNVAVQDEFEKKWGIPAKSITGRENRLPHSRVKVMVTKAEQEGYQRAVKEATEGKHTPQLAEFQTKVQDYEGRLEKVAQFEHVLENDPKTFLNLLSQIPAYKEFFDYIGQLAQKAQGSPAAGQAAVPDGMPQPDQTLGDGTKVYSMDGLQNLLKWQAENVEKRAVAKVQEHYAPMEREWHNRQQMDQMVPVIERQIADARTWPNFTELEPDVVRILKSDPNISLERAYVKAYQEIQVPKVSADRNKIRTEVLAELKQKPVSSSAPSSQIRPGAQPTANRTMDQVIADSLREAGLIH